MLCLSRRIGERIMVGDDIIVTVVDIDYRGKVRIGISAPKDVAINREELLIEQRGYKSPIDRKEG